MKDLNLQTVCLDKESLKETLNFKYLEYIWAQRKQNQSFFYMYAEYTVEKLSPTGTATAPQRQNWILFVCNCFKKVTSQTWA